MLICPRDNKVPIIFPWPSNNFFFYRLFSIKVPLLALL